MSKIEQGLLTPSELSFFFKTQTTPEVSTWLKQYTSQTPTVQSQAVLRMARCASSFWSDSRERFHLLFGLPLTLQKNSTSLDWLTLRQELQFGLAHALIDLEVDPQLSGAPVPVEQFARLSPTELAEWVSALQLRRDPSRQWHVSTSDLGALVWPGLLSFNSAQKDDVERLFFSTSALAMKQSRSTLMRIEALAEEAHAEMRCLPPTAAWNVCSFSRIAAARVALDPLRKGSGPFTAWREGQEVHVQEADSAPTHTFYFPEELDSDIAPLFKGWCLF
ncbi:hypothetical protein LC612_30510 [Nostoc sp. CHAB 5834]|nr:hypothetical protein [Nostoc sp. CHAB 5834]